MIKPNEMVQIVLSVIEAVAAQGDSLTLKRLVQALDSLTLSASARKRALDCGRLDDVRSWTETADKRAAEATQCFPAPPPSSAGAEMTLDQYQGLAMRTKPDEDAKARQLLGCLGLAGETGELIDYLKKVFYHGHDLSYTRLGTELGDVLWYCALLADAFGLNLGDVATHNIGKLRLRYPDGFSHEASRTRAPEDES